MSSKSTQPGEPDGAPVESRRTPAAADVGSVSPDETETDDSAEDVLDTPDLGVFSGEAARPTPLDDIAEAERDKVPRD